MGFCKTRVSVTKLNHIIVNEFVSQGVNAVGVSPCGGWVTDHGSVVQSDTASIQNLLVEGYQPVMHGDCVLDRHQGCTILSGDTIIEKLCSVFEPKRVIFLTDIDGVYDKPPSHPDAQLLPVIKVTHDGCLSVPVATTQQAHDVTGGILKKLSTATSIVTESKGFTTVFVCRINSSAASNLITHGELLGELGTEIKMQFREDV
ncbi:isopentenyl phosphate kinase-like isoform X2 [Patiria miniata]|nr:isopentenyl phosphate kinase-like isoform X2 [Patiria miniata]